MEIEDREDYNTYYLDKDKPITDKIIKELKLYNKINFCDNLLL
jgi:hypothetical protein